MATFVIREADHPRFLEIRPSDGALTWGASNRRYATPFTEFVAGLIARDLEAHGTLVEIERVPDATAHLMLVQDPQSANRSRCPQCGAYAVEPVEGAYEWPYCSLSCFTEREP